MPVYSFIQSWLTAAVRVSLWSWIAALFGAQTLGAIILINLLKLRLNGMILPVSLLLLGTILALVFGWRDDGRDEGCEKGQWKYWVPAIIYAAFIFSLSHMTFPAVSLPVRSDYFHPLEYWTLGIFLCCVWRSTLDKRGILFFSTLVISSGVVYGIADEVHQAFVPGRDPSMFDLLMDTFGLSLGCATFLLVRYVKRFAAGQQYVAGNTCSGINANRYKGSYIRKQPE
jgi:VanZ family protein